MILSNLFFVWRKIAFQCCVDFCHTTWINHKCTYIPSLLVVPPLSVITEPRAELPVLLGKVPTGYLLYIWWCVYVNADPAIGSILSFPWFVLKSVLYICVCILALQIGSSVPVFPYGPAWELRFRITPVLCPLWPASPLLEEINPAMPWCFSVDIIFPFLTYFLHLVNGVMIVS